MYTTKSVTSIWGQFLSLGFFSLGDKKKVQFELIQRIFAKEMCQNLQILRNLRFFFLKSSYLDNLFQQVTKIQQSKIYLLSSLTCSQIWLILLVDDCQCDSWFFLLWGIFTYEPNIYNKGIFLGFRVWGTKSFLTLLSF